MSRRLVYVMLQHKKKITFIMSEYFKEVIGCYMHVYKLFELKCVLAVCVNNHPKMIKK